MGSCASSEGLGFSDADVRGDNLGQESVQGCGARRAEDRDTRLVEPLRVVLVVGGPAPVKVEGDAPAELAFEHGPGR